MRGNSDVISKNTLFKWVQSLACAPGEYRLHKDTDSSLFATCFALYLYDLFGITKEWGVNVRSHWVHHIQSFQESEFGYFVPKGYNDTYDTKEVYQLTSFCLSALTLLGERPLCPFAFMRQWKNKTDVRNYLHKYRCEEGVATSGNMAMFLAIFLTYEYERTKDEKIKDLIDEWFAFHDEYQNQTTGFWGKHTAQCYYEGFQNAFHQFIIYHYWKRPIAYFQQIVDRVLELQDAEGHFAPYPGGGACWDYDATDILIHCGLRCGYREDDIQNALKKLFNAIVVSQKENGSFCETKKHPVHIGEIIQMKNMSFMFNGMIPYVWFYRFREMVRVSRKPLMRNHWSPMGWRWDEGDLWSTWFRCLTVAIIDRSLTMTAEAERWNFHKSIGLGYFT